MGVDDDYDDDDNDDIVGDDNDDDVDNFFSTQMASSLRHFRVTWSGRYPACASLTKTCKLVNLEAF